jgi:flavin-dependent dehydrogenase
MKTYDAVISGAGPAGCSAALSPARKGYRVLLLEKERFPREMVCGQRKGDVDDWLHFGAAMGLRYVSN